MLETRSHTSVSLRERGKVCLQKAFGEAATLGLGVSGYQEPRGTTPMQLLIPRVGRQGRSPVYPEEGQHHGTTPGWGGRGAGVLPAPCKGLSHQKALELLGHRILGQAKGRLLPFGFIQWALQGRLLTLYQTTTI